MAKGSKRPKKPAGNPKSKRGKGPTLRDEHGADMDDEIDTFHKQREMIPLDVNADSGGDSDDEEMEHAVFDLKDGEATDSEDYDGSGDDVDGDDNDEIHGRHPSLAAKIARQAKFLQQRIGSTGDDIHEDESEEEKRIAWGRNKSLYFGGDNVDFEILSSDEELLAEEDEALRIQKEKAKQLSMEDFDLDDFENDDDDHEKSKKSLQDIFPTKGSTADSHVGMRTEDMIENFVEIKKDLGALSKEEQMELVHSSAPELIGLLSELNDTVEQLQTVESFLCKLKGQNSAAQSGIHYSEVKQRVLLVYCQAIAFYLLLKSEGYPVRDHPVVSRLVEIKSLLEKIKQIDAHVPSQIESVKSDYGDEHKRADGETTKSDMEVVPSVPLVDNMDELVKVGVSKDYDPVNMSSNKTSQVEQLGLQSKEMLKIRAILEEKLKQKGVYGHMKARSNQSQICATNFVNKRLESLADFDDEVADPAKRHGVRNGLSLVQTTKLSQLVATKGKKPKMISGDEDLPKRDDIGERRMKHELRILSRAGVGSMDDDAEEMPIANRKSVDADNHDMESEDEFYKEAKRQKAAKVSARAEFHSRAQVDSLQLPQEEADGKRQITRQIEKNRGLTRNRKKLTKNPRKKYKLKHEKAAKRRKGQVRDIRKPSGPYGGEATGINYGVSRSVRFK